jgi:hypothetical protein
MSAEGISEEIPKLEVVLHNKFFGWSIFYSGWAGLSLLLLAKLLKY